MSVKPHSVWKIIVLLINWVIAKGINDWQNEVLLVLLQVHRIETKIGKFQQLGWENDDWLIHVGVNFNRNEGFQKICDS